MIVSSSRGYILHKRKFEKSLLVELFTYDYGRIRASLFHAVKQGKGKFFLEPFIPLSCTWKQQNDMRFLTKLEIQGYENKTTPLQLPKGQNLMAAFYLNELIIKALPLFESYKQVFNLYERALVRLQTSSEYKTILIIFAKYLLKYMGYELNLAYDNMKNNIIKNAYYKFEPVVGLIKCDNISDTKQLILGDYIMQLHQNAITSDIALTEINKIITTALNNYLGINNLKSQELVEKLI